MYENKIGKTYENIKNEIGRSKSQTKWILIAAINSVNYQLICYGRGILKKSFFIDFPIQYTSHTLFSEINLFGILDENFNQME